MASSDNVEISRELRPEKVVVITGPSFGTAVKFMLLGAAVGAGAAYWFLNNRGSAASEEDALLEGLSAGHNKPDARASNLVARAGKLAKRIKNLAGRAKETAQAAGKTIGPVLSEALHEAKEASQEAVEKMQEELEELKGSNGAPPPNVTPEQA